MSKFGNLKQIREQINSEAKADIPATRNVEIPKRRITETPKRRITETPTKRSSDPPVTPEPKRIGRPPAKRSDPDYTQVSGYIRRSTFLATKRKLLDDGDREFSELMEQLLIKWLK
jgi:hypothetical protein